MSTVFASRLILFLVFFLVSTEGWSAGRAIRVDNSSNWNNSSIGAAACTGTVANSTIVNSLTYSFLGRGNTATENYNTNAYCEVALPGTLNKNDYFHDDENGLRALFGNGNGITAIRYDFLDNSAIFSADGFQWTFFTFPSGATLVGLYGLDGSINGIAPDSTSYVKKGATVIWSGSSGYQGQYFCFQNNVYIGSWDGNASDFNSACLNAVGVIYINGFEASN
jgi:hypothetical protein